MSWLRYMLPARDSKHFAVLLAVLGIVCIGDTALFISPPQQGVCAAPAALLRMCCCMQFLLREMSPGTALPTLALAARLACASLHSDTVRQAVRVLLWELECWT